VPAQIWLLQLRILGVLLEVDRGRRKVGVVYLTQPHNFGRVSS
jgi:hypothetical protein